MKRDKHLIEAEFSDGTRVILKDLRENGESFSNREIETDSPKAIQKELHSLIEGFLRKESFENIDDKIAIVNIKAGDETLTLYYEEESESLFVLIIENEDGKNVKQFNDLEDALKDIETCVESVELANESEVGEIPNDKNREAEQVQNSESDFEPDEDEEIIASETIGEKQFYIAHNPESKEPYMLCEVHEGERVASQTFASKEDAVEVMEEQIFEYEEELEEENSYER